MFASSRVRQLGLTGWRAAEGLFDTAFGSRLNPLRHLGAIGMLAFGVLAGSGTVLYVMFDTSLAGAWHSIDDLARLPFGTGRLLRGAHRYAADVLVIVMAIHLLREWLHGHACGFRRFSWLTGVTLIGFVFASAIGGFWLNWDALGQYSAIATAEWLDALPLLAVPVARNFLESGAISDRLFSLFIFVHVGVALMLMFALWFHVQRISRPEVIPPRRLTTAVIALLALLALGWPVTSHAPADPATIAQALRLDWILLFLHPLVDATSAATVWTLVTAAGLLLAMLPFLPQPARAPAAVVDPANCNGCRRCLADCPYAAISMLPHPDRRVGRELAQVNTDLCAGCGICAGACPSSTPFRSTTHLLTGIDLPQRTVGELRSRLRRLLAASSAEHPLVVFACDHGAREPEPATDVCAIDLLCAGQLPPSFVEYALRDGAAGVLVATCREGGCAFRLGQRWTIERLHGARDPHLRASVPAERLELAFTGPGDEPVLAAAIERLRRRVKPLGAPHRGMDD